MKDFRFKLVTAKDLFSFQAGVALLFANDRDAPVARQPVVVGTASLVGSRSVLKFNMTSTPLFVTRVLQGPSLIGCGRSVGPRLPTLVAWVSFRTLRGLNFFGAIFMIRWRSRPFCTIMNGFGFRMTLLWSSQFHLSRRCSVLGSVLSMLSSRQVLRCLGPGTCPRSGPFARLVRVLTVLDSTGVSSCRRWLCRTFLPNSLFPRAYRHCGCLHLISYQQRSTRSRNTRRRAHRSHTRA